VQQVPELGPLMLGVPLTFGIPEREDALLGTRALLVAPRAAEGGVEVSRLERVEQRLGFQKTTAALCADQERLGAVGNRLVVGVNDQAGADFAGVPVPEINHLL